MPFWLDQEASLRMGENRPAGPKGLPCCAPRFSVTCCPFPSNGVTLAHGECKSRSPGKDEGCLVLAALSSPLTGASLPF